MKLTNFVIEVQMSKLELKIAQPITLPCGITLKNRIVKSAMSENMADDYHQSTKAFANLYSRWALGGVGLCITGNVMVDEKALGEPGNIVLNSKFLNHNNLAEWAKQGTQNQTALWVQLNHPGKQSPNFLSKVPVAPSAIPFSSPMNAMFNTPRELRDNEILNIISAFSFAAKMVKEAGFSGVQIHGAHGYLVSQFLSPRHNQRTDRWGGSLENRMRFVIEIYKSIRAEVGTKFPIGIKLNSSDFQKGGFSEEDSLDTVKVLSELGIDLIEISGGTYEVAAMTGKNIKEVAKSTLEREAYFLDFTKKIRASTICPILLTGGFRTLKGMESALSESSFDMIGLARSMAIDPELPNKLLSGKESSQEVIKRTTGIKKIDSLFPLEIIWYTQQLVRMGKKLNPNPNLSNWYAILNMIWQTGLAGLKRTRVR